MDHIQGIDRSEISIFTLEEMVAKDSRARLSDFFVNALGYDEPGFKSVETVREGRPSFNLAIC